MLILFSLGRLYVLELSFFFAPFCMDYGICFIEAGYEFDKAALMEYNHMSFGGPPVSVDTIEEADRLMQCDMKVSEVGKFLQTTKPFTLAAAFFN